MEALHRISVEEFKQCEKSPVVLVLDNVRSALNVGSIFRTADAFRISKILLCGITACPPNAEIRKTALGAEQSVEWGHCADSVAAVNALKADGYTIIAIEQAVGSVMIDKMDLSPYPKVALIFGNEVKGVAQEIVDISDLCIEIPQEGTKHSLNISCCAAIVMWHCFEKMAISGQ